VQLHLPEEEAIVLGNAIQLEQVFINLLTNARDTIANAERKSIAITCTRQANSMDICLYDTSPGIPAGLEQRILIHSLLQKKSVREPALVSLLRTGLSRSTRARSRSKIVPTKEPSS
jgi:phosphoglycerate-specific signal transduction histidine kinase